MADTTDVAIQRILSPALHVIQIEFQYSGAQIELIVVLCGRFIAKASTK